MLKLLHTQNTRLNTRGGCEGVHQFVCEDRYEAQMGTHQDQTFVKLDNSKMQKSTQYPKKKMKMKMKGVSCKRKAGNASKFSQPPSGNAF